MKSLNFLKSGRSVELFNSQGAAVLHVAALPSRAQVNVITIAPGGVLGYHPAASNQLFLVIQGEGWVRCGEPPEEAPVQAGTGVFWAAGEWHETRSATGLAAIVIEGEDLQLAAPG